MPSKLLLCRLASNNNSYCDNITIFQQPSFDLPCWRWSLLNHFIFQTSQDPHLANLHRWGQISCLYTVSQKKLSRFVFVRTSSNFTNFDNFWQKDGERSKYMQGALIFHLT